MKISPEFEAEILSRPGTLVNGQPVAMATVQSPKKSAAVRKPKLLDPGWAVDEQGLILTVPVATVSETNARQWHGRSQRSQLARKAVRRACIGAMPVLNLFERHAQEGGGLRVRFVRIGGNKMDRSNLPAACKATEDALAYMLGVDDGDPVWHPEWDQEPGGDSQGVRVEVSKL